VAFVFREQVPDPAAIFADNFHHLLTFAGGHPRVVQPQVKIGAEPTLFKK